MPSFLTKTFSSFFNRLCQVNQSGNSGADATVRTMQTGDGVDTALSFSTRHVKVTNTTHNTTTAFVVTNKDNENILAVDTDASKVLVGASQVNTLTLFKEMGLYDFTPEAGYHYPLVANTMHFETAFAADRDWGNGIDPAVSLDVSGLTQQENAIAVYWYLENNITLDSVRYMITADGADSINLHLESYDLDVSSNHGDLSSGFTCASVSSISAKSTAVITGTFTLDSADIDANKVVIGFVESDSTTDLSVAFNIKYHIR